MTRGGARADGPNGVDFRLIISSRTMLTGAQGGERADMSRKTLNIMAQSKIEKDYGTCR